MHSSLYLRWTLSALFCDGPSTQASLLVELCVQDKSVEELGKLGGVRGVADALHTNLEDGLASGKTGSTSLEGRQIAFGANRFKAIPLKSFFSLLVGNLKDPTLILLMAAALVSLYSFYLANSSRSSAV